MYMICSLNFSMLPHRHRRLWSNNHCLRVSEESRKLHLHPLRWRHNERDGISDHQPHDCLLNVYLGTQVKKTSKLRVAGLCAGNSSVTGEFPTQRASNTENVSIWWRHHANYSSHRKSANGVHIFFECAVKFIVKYATNLYNGLDYVNIRDIVAKHCGYKRILNIKPRME